MQRPWNTTLWPETNPVYFVLPQVKWKHPDRSQYIAYIYIILFLPINTVYFPAKKCHLILHPIRWLRHCMGCVIRIHSGDWIICFMKDFTVITNSLAELNALFQGLKLAVEYK